jgi:hypothetical protein
MYKKLTTFVLFLVGVLPFVISCSSDSDEKIEGYKTNEIIVVTLDIKEQQGIEKVTLLSSGNKDSILKREIGNRTTIKLKCPQKGEGVFSLCVYLSQDTICSKEGYVEGGYRPKLIFRDKTLKVVKWL